ncbi:MAG: hypothetical protein ACXAEX_01550 [Promethearchaeota archaeon]
MTQTIVKEGIVERKEDIICQKCIMLDGPFGVRLNTEGFCSICEDPTYETPTWKKIIIRESLRQKKREEWDKLVRTWQEQFGTENYCCLLGFSGGKDSTALLDTFINEYHLKPFLVTVNVGFMTDIAKNNIRQTLKKLNIETDHIFIEDSFSTFTKLYKYFLSEYKPQSDEKCVSLSICHTCTDLIHTALVKEAMKRDLDYVIVGFSPDQIARYFFETAPSETLEDGLPHPQEHLKNLDDDDLQWYLSPNTPLEEIPHVLYPYHVIDYDQSEIIQRIESKGLIEAGKGDPVLTNCHVVMTGMMYDLYRFGGVSYSFQYAELVRQQEDPEKRKQERKGWLRTMVRVARGLLNGQFATEGITKVLDRVGISRQELISTIEAQVDRDPNNDQIWKNRELLKKGRFK